jgi:hypothetical protein
MKSVEGEKMTSPTSQCPKCSTPYSCTIKFCPECGTRLGYVVGGGMNCDEILTIDAIKALPADSDKWELIIDEDCTTVAHTAAGNGCLPPDFNKWELTDKNGWTVAYAAFLHKRLPPDFDKWELTKSPMEILIQSRKK